MNWKYFLAGIGCLALAYWFYRRKKGKKAFYEDEYFRNIPVWDYFQSLGLIFWCGLLGIILIIMSLTE
jgi:hypothetical protein